MLDVGQTEHSRHLKQIFLVEKKNLYTADILMQISHVWADFSCLGRFSEVGQILLSDGRFHKVGQIS